MSTSRRGLLIVAALIACLCLSLAFAAGFGTYRIWLRGHGSTQPAVFWEAWEHVEQNFYGALPSPRDRTYAAIRESLALLNDPYTIFVEPQTRELERDRMQGTFGGIGVDLWRDADGRMILSPYDKSPAKEAGVMSGDILLALDGVEIAVDTPVDEVSAYLHGQIGTTATLTILRPASATDGIDSPTLPFDLSVVRGEIHIPSVTWRVLDQARDVGYLRVEFFSARTGDEVVTGLGELEQEGITHMILDLRDNAGGLVDPAVVTASQFLDEGVVLYEQERDSGERHFSVQPGGIATDVPLVVLVNGGTSSAAEIVAGALQAHDRAPLLGESTFGKGAVQLIYELSDGSSLHVTSAIWLTPDRERIEGRGLEPDILVADTRSGMQDIQLDRAVQYLQSQSRRENN